MKTHSEVLSHKWSPHTEVKQNKIRAFQIRPRVKMFKTLRHSYFAKFMYDTILNNKYYIAVLM
jgi:hypothetical protein